MDKEDFDPKTRAWYEGLRHGLLYGYEDKMKVEQPDSFKPVIITLHTLTEFIELRDYLFNASETTALPPSVRQLLESFRQCSES